MKSYFVFLSRHKLYTAIQAIGLIISIAFIILIGNYAWQQYRNAYDYPYIDRVYVVGCERTIGLSEDDKDILESQLPGLEAITRYSPQEMFIRPEEEYIKVKTLSVDEGFFDIFQDIEIIEGNTKDLIAGESVFVSKEFANTYLEEGNIIGSKIFVNNDFSLTVKGVFEPTQRSVHEPRDLITIFKSATDPNYSPFNSIGSTLTFIKMKEAENRESLLEKVEKIERPNYNEDWIKEFRLYSIPELYFSDNQWFIKNGSRTLLRVLIGVVLLLLVSSMINFINLSIALEAQRAKEFATKRLLGSSKFRVVVNHIRETILFVFMCSLIGVALAYIFRAPIDQLLFSSLLSSPNDEWRITHLEIIWTLPSIFTFLGIILLLGLTAGIFPSLLSFNFNPIDIVRGNFRFRNRTIFSKLFIVIQSIISIILISIAILMEMQLKHMSERPLNASTDNTYLLRANFVKYDWAYPLIQKIENIPGVIKVGFGESYPGRAVTMQPFFKGDPENPDNKILTNIFKGDKNYFSIMNLNIIEGDKEPSSSETLYVSESLANFFGSDKNGIENILKAFKTGTDIDFKFGGIYLDVPGSSATTDELIPSSAFFLIEDSLLNYSSHLLISVLQENDDFDSQILDSYNAYRKGFWGYYDEPYLKGFINELENKNISRVRSTVVLIEIFTGISIVLSLIGLIAMSTYYANENTKGIAIRKVLGSEVKGEIWRNISLYMILILIAIAVAIPLAIIISREYLLRFAYRIENYWWIFVVASVSSILTAFLSVYWQISRAAHINPAQELKKE